MFEKITVIDIETPDRMNSRICSIGITRVENREIVGAENFLIDPECDFFNMNMAKHHIRPEDIEGKPTFPEFWGQYGGWFEDCIVAGHGVSFDLSVLKKTLEAYQITIEPFKYVDTWKMAKDFFHDLPNYRLPTLCESMGISLQPHDSGSDSLATAQVLLNILANHSEAEISEYLKDFPQTQMENDGEEKRFWGANVSPETKALLSLRNLIERMSGDGSIDYDDFVYLMDYIRRRCKGLYGRYPFDQIIDKINGILADGEVTKKELEDFTTFCKAAFDPVSESKGTFDGTFEGKHIVLTGDFAIAQKSQVEKQLKERGAIIQNSVSSKTEMVIVGKLGSPAWKMGTFGGKVEKALQLQGKGCNIQILKEEDVFGS